MSLQFVFAHVRHLAQMRRAFATRNGQAMTALVILRSSEAWSVALQRGMRGSFRA